ncbi:MAG: hypothetical protein IJV85_00560 [Clostridia bacterium]|nr:hypothetical protein [Clostridia bacterium]
MHKTHVKNTVRYYLILIAAFVLLFFSNDFGLIDVQKTAIVLAVGIDREDDTFIVTSQIAVPQPSKQEKSTKSVQLVSRGETVAEAFEEINAKTGWYPKLVFCRLILLGEKACEQNVFDALDYFLRDEYMSDNCLLAACDGHAKDVLNVTALVDATSSTAIEKVLSQHAERVGAVLTSTLREFSIGYFSEGRSGYLPVIKIEPQQETVGSESSESAQKGSPSQDGQKEKSKNESSSGESSKNSESSSEESSSQSSSDSGNGSSKESKSSSGDSGGNASEPLFSAGETALFVGGKRVDTLTKEESFAVNVVLNKLQLATYSLRQGEEICSLTIKRNEPKMKLTIGKNGIPSFKIQVTCHAGILDYSKSQDLSSLGDVGDVPRGSFPLAETLLKAQIVSAFEKTRACGCDLFGIVERLEKYQKKHFYALRGEVLDRVVLNATISFKNIR